MRCHIDNHLSEGLLFDQQTVEPSASSTVLLKQPKIQLSAFPTDTNELIAATRRQLPTHIRSTRPYRSVNALLPIFDRSMLNLEQIAPFAHRLATLSSREDPAASDRSCSISLHVPLAFRADRQWAARTSVSAIEWLSIIALGIRLSHPERTAVLEF